MYPEVIKENTSTSSAPDHLLQPSPSTPAPPPHLLLLLLLLLISNEENQSRTSLRGGGMGGVRSQKGLRSHKPTTVNPLITLLPTTRGKNNKSRFITAVWFVHITNSTEPTLIICLFVLWYAVEIDLLYVVYHLVIVKCVVIVSIPGAMVPRTRTIL